MTQIHGYIKYLTVQATHELGFGVWRMLKVQAAHRATLDGKGMVDLHDAFAGDQRSQLLGAIKPLQIPAAVTDGFPLDEFEALQRGVENIKATTYDRRTSIKQTRRRQIGIIATEGSHQVDLS